MKRILAITALSMMLATAGLQAQSRDYGYRTPQNPAAWRGEIDGDFHNRDYASARRSGDFRDDAYGERYEGSYYHHDGARSAAIIGGGAATGALIGAAAGHGQGAAIGAFIGGIAGLVIDQSTQHQYRGHDR